ncbi:hypothetical protein AAKU55_004908 [Oxalobacteraceae bacterium GrIS 1.11]
MKTVCFYVAGADGVIRRSGTCQAADLALQAQEGETVAEGVADYASQYVLDGEVRNYSDIELRLKNNLPRGWAWKMPERRAVDVRDLAQARAQAWQRIKDAREAASLAPFEYGGAVYEADVAGIGAAAQQAALDPAFRIAWRLLDNTLAALDAPGMRAVNAALFVRNSRVRAIADALREAINAARDAGALDAIAWPG